MNELYLKNSYTVDPVIEPTGSFITPLAFLSRFTDEEAIAIDLASIGATVEAASVRRYLSKVNAAQYIDLQFEDTRKGVQKLEELGLLQEGRALIILDTLPSENELYHIPEK